MAKAEARKWEFKARFRRHAFGWKSQPAIPRVKQAVAEIRKVARKEPLVAAEGAVTFLERVSPALEQVDSSSGAIGTAVGHAITELVPIIASAPAEAKTREAWLERLFEAHEADEIPYIERLADHWGDLCASKEIASAWADRQGLDDGAIDALVRDQVHAAGVSGRTTSLRRTSALKRTAASTPSYDGLSQHHVRVGGDPRIHARIISGALALGPRSTVRVRAPFVTAFRF